jgi:hypothetical protein
MNQPLESLLSRDELGYWLNANDMRGVGVEIGTFKGEYAHHLLSTWNGETLHTCDPWKHYDGYLDGCVLDHSTPERPRLDMEKLKKEAEGRLKEFGSRCQIHRLKGTEMLEKLVDGSLTFCYLDGFHGRETVAAELNLAWNKVGPGGIVGGHDFYSRHDSLQDCGVLEAVWDFCHNKIDKRPHVTFCTSWWFQKP